MGKYIVVKVEADRHGDRAELIDNRCIGINSFNTNFKVSHSTHILTFMQARLAEQYTIIHHSSFIHSFLGVGLEDILFSRLAPSSSSVSTITLLYLVRTPSALNPFTRSALVLIDNRFARGHTKGGEVWWRKIQILKVTNVCFFFFYSFGQLSGSGR